MAGVIKLRLSELGLYGRDKELSILKEFCHRVEGNGSKKELEEAADGATCHQQSELVLVSGGAGTGKSTLVQKLGDGGDSSGFIFVSGKFDDQRETTGKPYSAISVAFRDLLQRITDVCDEADRRQMGEEIHKAIGSGGVEVLETVAVGVQRLVLGENDKGEESNVATASAEALNRLKFAVRSFLRVVCSESHPVVLFLDDLQWADEASLELIRSIATDPELAHFLLVGAFRNEEVGANTAHPLAVTMKQIEQERPITSIHLDDLDVETVTMLVADLLRLEEETVAELSELVHQRTGGNAFFVLQFLSTLQEYNMIYYDLAGFEWRYDIERIRSETDISDNVVELVATKIQGLPAHIQTVLKVMACFPSNRVELALLQSILQGLDMAEFGEGLSLVEVLNEACDEALLDRIGSGSFKFTHDRIREGAYSLIPEGQERDMFHLRIGEVVMDILASHPDRHSLKFVAADQLNHGFEYITDEKQIIKLASLNLEAGKLAVSISAFVPAAAFFDRGIVVLRRDPDHWDGRYDLSLELFSLAASIANLNGDFELHQRMVDEVVAHANCVEDTLPVYCILVESLTVQQKIDKAMDVGFDILAQLGQRFPKRLLSFHARTEYQKIKKALRTYSDNELLLLPKMTDQNMIVASRLMSHMDRCAYYLQDQETMALVCFRQLQCMLEFGLNEESPYMFAKYGMMLCGNLGDITEGYRFGSLSLKLLDRYKEREAVVVLVVHSFILHWQSPAQDRIDPLFMGASVGMAKGDINHAFLCTVGYLYFFFHSGLPLTEFEKDSRGYCLQMESYKQDLALIEVRPLWQGALNLMGKSNDPLVVSGDAMDQDKFLQDAIPTAKQKVYLIRMQLAYYFGDPELATRMLELCEKLMVTIAGHFVFEVFTFFCGLIYLDEARRRKKKSNMKLACKKIQRIREWVRNGAVNCVHKLLLLEAEYASVNSGEKSKRDEIKKLYDSAISAASRSGFVHDAALANERAGIWFQSLDDDFWASSYLSRAHELYHEWGATAKADQLAHRLSLESVSQPNEQAESRRFAKGKSRFDLRTSERQKSTRIDVTELSPAASATLD